MGKKLFFLSLIVLAVAMGIKWNKIRPKTKTGPARERVALNLQDLQLQDKPGSASGDSGDQTDGEIDKTDQEQPGDAADTSQDGENSEGETETSESEGSVATDTIGLDDPILLALRSMKRNPFEKSPYAQLVLEIQKKEEIAAKPTEKKSVKLLNARFTATIETRKELVAVIDSRLYRKGELFQDKKISEIKAEIVSLESGPDTFLIPKHGVNVSIAEDGSYTVVDSYQKN